ncbi:platelet-activating factor acetylhydrolase-like isoform X2 [Ischnura elegans]|uniref:platelet-activating factor acetylhydrolase-like isoform X2 n=1 Tax=Ischnura elegans TaxID=197161 RepID=UPI001ED87476|nr:platelet-activating factor acetylhydrolase-like isoform X2 [Ischnura elegans]
MWELLEKMTKAVHLPVPTGPYVPGGVDIMTEYSSSGSFIRLYYPSESVAIKNRTPQFNNNFQKRWIPWLPDSRYFDGCARLMGLWKVIVWATYAIIAGVNAKIPVYWGSQFSPLEQEGKETTTGSTKPQKSKKHPMVIMSHGMAGNRFAHSALGLEMASHGFVVAVLEHRDGSASGTYYYKSKEMRDKGEKTWLPYKNVKFGNSIHHEVRKEQVEIRSEELIKALNLMEKINLGQMDDNDNILHGEYAGNEFKISQMKGRLNVISPAVIGFSFGGPSALTAIKKDFRFRRGIALDVWMFPIKGEIKEFGETLASSEASGDPRCKMLFINTETFHNDINLKATKELLDLMKKGSNEPTVATIRGTTHEYLCDWSLLLGSWLDLMHYGKRLPIHGHQLFCNLVLQFLAEQYEAEEDSGLTPELKSDCDDFLQCQLQHLVFDLMDGKSDQ